MQQFIQDPRRYDPMTALQLNDIKMFKSTLGKGNASPILTDDEQQLSILEMCCKTPDRAEFIRACLAWGCDGNKVYLVKRI